MAMCRLARLWLFAPCRSNAVSNVPKTHRPVSCRLRCFHRWRSNPSADFPLHRVAPFMPLSAGIPNGRCCVSAVRRRGDGSLSASTSIVGRRTPLPPVCCWHPKKVANALTAILSSPTLKPPTVSCGRIGHWHQPLCFPSVKRQKVNRGRLVMCHEVGRHPRRN